MGPTRRNGPTVRPGPASYATPAWTLVRVEATADVSTGRFPTSDRVSRVTFAGMDAVAIRTRRVAPVPLSRRAFRGRGGRGE